MNKYEVEVTAFAENSVRAIAFYIRNELKATPHDPRLTPLHIICLPAFRHITQILLEAA